VPHPKTATFLQNKASSYSGETPAIKREEIQTLRERLKIKKSLFIEDFRSKDKAQIPIKKQNEKAR
jgi:hypothetical protein